MTDDSFDPRYDPAFQRGFDRDRPATSPAGQTGARKPRVEPPPTAAPRPSASSSAPTEEPIWVPMREPMRMPTGEPIRVRATTEPVMPRVPAPIDAPTPAPAVDETDSDNRPAATDDAHTTDNTVREPRPGIVLGGNPFIYALIGVGVFLLALGLWGQWGAADGRTGSYRSPNELVMDEFLAGIGPWCMTLGIGTLVTVLVLYALHWRTPR